MTALRNAAATPQQAAWNAKRLEQAHNLSVPEELLYYGPTSLTNGRAQDLASIMVWASAIFSIWHGQLISPVGVSKRCSERVAPPWQAGSALRLV